MIGTIERARGRWAEILPRFGIDSQFLVNRKGPCPLCGGKDRFRYDDRYNNGDYFCNQCGPGGGITLVCNKNDWNFGKACREIDEIIGNEPPRPPSTAAVAAGKPPETRRAEIQAVLDQATDRSIAREYLIGRGLRSMPALLLGHPALAYYDQDGNLQGYFPAVIAPIVGPDGRLQSALRVYTSGPKPRKKMLKPVKTISGGAVRLFNVMNEELGVTEGIETAIAAKELFGISTWAALSTGGIEKFVPPAGLRRLVIYGDNDANFAGQKAAYALAARLSSTIAEVSVELPPEVGLDWLDELNERRKWSGEAA